MKKMIKQCLTWLIRFFAIIVACIARSDVYINAHDHSGVFPHHHQNTVYVLLGFKHTGFYHCQIVGAKIDVFPSSWSHTVGDDAIEMALNHAWELQQHVRFKVRPKKDLPVYFSINCQSQRAVNEEMVSTLAYDQAQYQNIKETLEKLNRQHKKIISTGLENFLSGIEKMLSSGQDYSSVVRYEGTMSALGNLNQQLSCVQRLETFHDVLLLGTQERQSLIEEKKRLMLDATKLLQLVMDQFKMAEGKGAILTYMQQSGMIKRLKETVLAF